MDARTISYGETAIDKLVQWLRARGEPADAETIARQYLKILRDLVVEEKA
ncbi:MAG: hypothetical protein MUD01_19885 [Chloroflexaceae bacterium]|jgi:hypothetical protein|nr:hypothetical protein [Chloroflexaceae bacterium]